MINKAAFLQVVIFCISIYVCSAQYKFHKPYKWSFDSTIADEPVINHIALSNGIQLEYAEQGNASGSPVIFLHGITDSWHSFETVFPFLPGSIHAFALSQRGHGNSSRPDSGYHPTNFAADLALFIKAKKLGKVIIVGHSMGGVIAQQFALDYPHLTAALVLLSTDAAFKDNPGLPEFNLEINKLSDPVSYRFADDFQKGTLAKPIDSVYYHVVVAESLKLPARVWKAAMDGLMQVDYTDVLKNIHKPALIFWGDKDAFCPIAAQHTFLQEILQSKLIIYEGAGHALHWEEPAKFVKDLVNFVNTIVSK